MPKASNGSNSRGIKTSMKYIFVVDGIVLMTSFRLKLFKPRVSARKTNLHHYLQWRPGGALNRVLFGS